MSTKWKAFDKSDPTVFILGTKGGPNPPKEGFVFGRASTAEGKVGPLGYYSMQTKEAYQILRNRLIKVEDPQ